MSATHYRLYHAGFAALAGAVVALGAGAAAAADDPFAGSAPVSITIHVSSRDLATPRQTKNLAIRIRAAASAVCGGDVDPVVRTSDLFASCREAAIDRAVRALDSPTLARALGRSAEQLAGERPQS
ncbi:MAG TPA: UrcA family protein [Caulobacteraceae bacterium]|nr:UrcA family protein [Caulobacteraceae bacterium]